VKLGVGLPTFLGNVVSASDVLDWARVADDAGFHSVAVHDKPYHDTWEPLAALAAVAAVTKRVRLVTGALLLPTRDEALVAKQAAVIDQVSDGRLDLGVALGARAEDFELFGRSMKGRGATFERQVQRLLDLWAAAQETRETGAEPGPASVQEPHVKLWIGGYTDEAITRAVKYGDGYIFGAPGVAALAARIPLIREAARAAGRDDFPVQGLAYILPSEDPEELAEGERLLTRYYKHLHKPYPELVHQGSAEQLIAKLKEYETTGIDVLNVIPVARTMGPLERLAADVLPAFR